MIARIFVIIAMLATTTAVNATQPGAIDLVTVVKSQRMLYLMSGPTVVAKFHVALGGNPVGGKQRAGDQRTPEGRYVLDFRKSDSAFFRAIHISYPSPADQLRARRLGVSPGSAIMIHGQKNGLDWLSFASQRFDWTDGCIALSNADMQQVWNLVQVPTPVQIVP